MEPRTAWFHKLLKRKNMKSIIIMLAAYAALSANTITLEGKMACTMEPISASSSSAPLYSEDCPEGLVWNDIAQACVDNCKDGIMHEGQCLEPDVYDCVTTPGMWWSPDFGGCLPIPG